MLANKCGKQSLFGSELPCPSNELAAEPGQETRDAVVQVCGNLYKQGPLCCDLNQVQDLKRNLKKAENIIASCPACKENFVQFFCAFTCSPDQSLFVNVTATAKSTSGQVVTTELQQYVAPELASAFYDSCKEVQFSATNGRAMDLIGGGAKNYSQFLKFLGDKKPLLGGSPFQMNFPWSDDEDHEKLPNGLERLKGTVYSCSDPNYKCACSDCSDSCPALEPVESPEGCYVGAIPCLSFGILVAYASSLVVFVIVYSAIVIYRNRRLGTVRLLQDEDEDETNWDNETSDRRFFRDADRLSGPYSLNTILQLWFSKLGAMCANHPYRVFLTTFILVLASTVGIFRFTLEVNPVRLWVSPSSVEFHQKQFFDENFGPFYRAEQAYVVNETGSVLTDYETLQWWFEVEQRVSQLQTDDGITLDKICLKPTGEACVIQSVTQYFGGDIKQLPEKSYKSKIRSCASSPVNCLPPFQQPLNKEMIFGGYENDNVLTSEALVITWVVENSEPDSPEANLAAEWEVLLEQLLLEVQEEAKARGLRLSFSTERSLEKELNKSSNTDAKIVAISYVCMFIYASLALGGVVPSLSRTSLIRTKFSLGLFGIFAVLLSVLVSVSFFSLFHVSATLIIAEVIPFLILAVGVDNIFLLTHELENVNIAYPNNTVEERVARAVGHIGPSILLSSVCETITFALGATVGMPAVKNFAIYSAGAVFINSVLQLTMFVSALCLDQKRVEAGRIDWFPFWKLDKTDSDEARESFSTVTARLLGSPAVFEKFNEPTFSKIIRKFYAPYLLRPAVMKVVVVIFTAWVAIAIALLPKVELGLDQRLAVPSDSYMVDYFNDLYDYFDSGPPLYFITHGSNMTERQTQQALCGRFSTCQELSLVNIVEQERKRSVVSFVHVPVASWIDDYFQWLNPSLDECCRVKKTNHDQLCSPNASPRTCDVCFQDKPYSINMTGLPEGQEFMKYFKLWINAPSDPCPLGGKAPYSSSVVPDYENVNIKTSSFRSAHTPLRSQRDFINAYASARRISEEITKSTGVETFAYSNFYIFFAQYTTIVKDSILIISSALAVIFLLCSLILGSLRTSIVVLVTVAMIVVDIVGFMAIWEVSLNALSLVNLLICVGIGFEFCTHVARAFTFTQKVNYTGQLSVRSTSRAVRSFNALVGIGGSVLGGIALTKLIGVFVLAFTRSKIFEVYYFRMWLSLVFVASTHSLIFLPVALSLFGGGGYLIDQGDQGIVSDLVSRLHASDYSDGYQDVETSENDITAD